MRNITVIAIFLLLIVACVGMTRQQLEAEAMQSGDWSAVERAERRDARERTLNDMTSYCHVRHQTLVCREFGNTERCACMNTTDMQGIL